jgi:SMC interacting uncharacterized protein involved in chromosome segregation
MVLDHVRRMFLGNMPDDQAALARRVTRMQRTLKTTVNTWERLRASHVEKEHHVASLQQEIRELRDLVHEQGRLLSTYSEHLRDINTVRENMPAIIGEIQDVRDYASSCHAEVVRNIANMQDELYARDRNGYMVSKLNDDGVRNRAWSIHFEEDHVVFRNKQKEVGRLSSKYHLGPKIVDDDAATAPDADAAASDV